jgi:hypothetical protein
MATKKRVAGKARDRVDSSKIFVRPQWTGYSVKLATPPDTALSIADSGNGHGVNAHYNRCIQH